MFINDMKSLKVIEWSIWDHLSSVWEKIDSSAELQLIFGQYNENIK